MRDNLDVIERSVIVAIGRAFDGELIAGAKMDVRDRAACGGVGADFRGGELVVRRSISRSADR